MKNFKYFTFFLLFFFLIFGCNGQNKKIKNPENLEEGILYFQQNWSKKELYIFKIKNENDAVSATHFGAGMWLRNNWIKGNRNEKFYNYFEKIGITSPDDISSIVFTSLHRKLNGKEIDLESQIKEYKKYSNEIINCDEKLKNSSLKNYNKHKIGDKITIQMPVDFSDEERNAVLYNCPDIEWKFDDKKDLKFTAEILKKYHINSEQNVFFQIKILEMNYPNTSILGTDVSNNKIIDLQLSGLEIQ